MNRQELLTLLQKPSITVTFTKKDGTERVMKCTRDMNIIPTDFHPKGESEVQENLDIIKCFDLEVNAWRSFRVDSVKTVGYQD